MHVLRPAAGLSSGRLHILTIIGTLEFVCILSQSQVLACINCVKHPCAAHHCGLPDPECMHASTAGSTDVDGARAAAVAGQRPDVGGTVGGGSRAVIPCNPPQSSANPAAACYAVTGDHTKRTHRWPRRS